MIKRLVMLVACVFLASPMFAQLKPKIPLMEVFVGGSYFRLGKNDAAQRVNALNMAGWHTDFDYNLSKHVGVVLDLAGQYKKTTGLTTSHYEYMVGPQFKGRTGRVTVFGHGLFGGAAYHTPNSTRSGFATGVGGGLDINAGRLVAIRLFQVDSIHTHFGGVWVHNVRASVGVVFKIPRR